MEQLSLFMQINVNPSLLLFSYKNPKGISCSREKINRVIKGSTMDVFYCLINTITIFRVLYLAFDCQFEEQSMALDEIETT